MLLEMLHVKKYIWLVLYLFLNVFIFFSRPRANNEWLVYQQLCANRTLLNHVYIKRLF